jgi:RNA polymerase sigma factor (TIGR02999 family)
MAKEGLVADPYFSALYTELRNMAARELRRNSAAALSPTTLIHETFLNVSPRESTVLPNPQHFMSYIARAMRGVIIDYLRRGSALKRGNAFELVELSEDLPLHTDQAVERLHEALDSLATTHPRLAECVELKFFCGFSFIDIAALWNVSERTVLRDWDKARLLLHSMMGEVAVN